jgi:hypothetical protein
LIGGWNIEPDLLSSGKVGLSSSGTSDDSVRIYAGNATSENAPFKVTNGGYLYSTYGEIGGWEIDATTLKSTNGLVGIDSTNEYSFWAGNESADSAGFYVKNNGYLYSNYGKIGGFDIGDSALYNMQLSYSDDQNSGVYIGTDGIGLGGGEFYVTKDGFLSVRQGQFGSDTDFGISGNFMTKVCIDGSVIKNELHLPGQSSYLRMDSINSINTVHSIVPSMLGDTTEHKNYSFFYIGDGGFGSCKIVGTQGSSDSADDFILQHTYIVGGELYTDRGEIGQFAKFEPNKIVFGFKNDIDAENGSIYSSRCVINDSNLSVQYESAGSEIRGWHMYPNRLMVSSVINGKHSACAMSYTNQAGSLYIGSKYDMETEYFKKIYIGTTNADTTVFHNAKTNSFVGNISMDGSFIQINGLDTNGGRSIKFANDGTEVGLLYYDGTYFTINGNVNAPVRIGHGGYTGATKNCLVGSWEISTTSSTTPVLSDFTKKNSICDFSSVHDTIFDGLRGVTFKYNEGTSDRIHPGFIAQEMYDAVISAGLTSQDFSAVCYDIDEDGNKVNWRVRYDEIVPLNTWQIQKLKARVAELENRLAQLEQQR